ncbi:MAG: STAS domain-containing protein [SAR324 cluster bacterium]|nr:STAS domain-containing protein [SAR324 cluster bacterium]
MQLNHRVEKNICILSVEGNIALDGVSDVKSYLKPFLDDDSIKGIVINFEGVNFIDSSGIGLIVSVFKNLQQRGAKLTLCKLSQKNQEIFNMTRLDKILSIHETEAQAISNI